MSHRQMDSHKRLLGILHIVYGGFYALLFLTISSFVRALLPFILSEVPPEARAIIETISEFVFRLGMLTVTILPIASLIGGIALLYKKDWGLIILLVTGCVALLSFPIGTALGVYKLWVFIKTKG